MSPGGEKQIYEVIRRERVGDGIVVCHTRLKAAPVTK